MDLTHSKEIVNQLISDIKSNSSVEIQLKSIKKMNELMSEYESYEAIAELNFNRDTKSEKYKAEKDYYDNLSPDFKDLKDQFSQELMKS